MRFALVDGDADTAIRFRRELLRSAAAQGHSVTLIAPAVDEARIRDHLSQDGIFFQPLPYPHSLNLLTQSANLARIFRILLSCKPDVILIATLKAISLTSVAAGCMRVSRVVGLVTGLGSTLNPSSGRLWRVLQTAAIWIYRLDFKFSHLVVFQNKDDQEWFRMKKIVSRDQACAIVDGSGVDINYFSVGSPHHFESNGSEITFLMHGRLIKEKGIFEYLEAAKRMKTSGLRARFLLVGPIIERWARDSQNMIEDCARKNIIEYVGPVSDIRPYLSKADVVVLPSYYGEGIPRSLLEALAAGRPIITTDTPGCRETVQHGWNGLLVPPRSVDALEGAMRSMLEHHSTICQMGRRSKEYAASRFDVRHTTAQLLWLLGLSQDSEKPDSGVKRWIDGTC